MMKSSARLLVLASSAIALVSCAGMTPPGAPPAAKQTSSGPGPHLPRVELDADTMYDILLGEIAGQRGDIATATTALGRAARKTRDPRLAERATLAAMYAKRPKEALAFARLWVEVAPDDPEAREALASVLLEQDRPAEARLHFERILAIEAQRNNVDQAYMRIATVLGRQRNRTAALEIMESLVRKHPDAPSAQFAMAHLAVRVGDLDTADAAIDKVLALKPDWEDAALFKGRVLVSQKDPVRAQTFYDRFLSRHPSATSVRVSYARYLIDQKQWEKALEQFKRVVSEAPNDADAVYAVGLLSLQTNHIGEAKKYLTRALELRPHNEQAKLYLGQAAEQEKHWDETIKWYRAVQPGEHFFEAQARIGVVMAKRGDLEGARRYLHAIKTRNDEQKVQLALAEEQVLRDVKQYREALHVLNTALESVAGDKDLLYARALVAEKLGMLDLAESDLRAILAKDPKNVHALNALGYTLADRTNRFEEAKTLLRQALTLKPDDPFILDSVGWLNYRMGNNAESVKYLRRALSIRNDAEISAHLGEVLWVMGDHNGAETVWSRALRETPDNEALLDAIKKFKP